MSVGELKELLKNVPNYLEIGGTGHFGELLKIEDVKVTHANVLLQIQYAGPDPEDDFRD